MLAVLHNDWAKAIADILSAEQLTDWYASAYTREMTDDDLDCVLAPYRSPIGQKMVLAERKAIVYLTGEMPFQKKLRGDPTFTAFCSEVQRVIFDKTKRERPLNVSPKQYAQLSRITERTIREVDRSIIRTRPNQPGELSLQMHFSNL
jgi:hypothetical protein